MADFASLDSNSPNIPLTGSSVAENALNLTNPDSILSGQNRGTQRVTNTDGSYVLIGNLPDNTFGIGFFDINNNLISKNNGVTQYVYDLTTGKNIMQIGKLPDGTYGMAVAKAGFNVSDAIIP